jgi:hypothetical protein
MTNPETTALAIYNFPAVTGVSYGTDKFEYDVTLDTPFFAEAGVKYWIAVQAVFAFSGVGQWGFATNGANPEQLSGPVQGFPQLSPPVPFWTPTLYGDHAFQLSGEDHQGPSEGNPPPGTYGIAGTIKNLGVTYSEIDIPVNAQVTNDTGVVVYDETIVVTGPIAPGGMVSVEFPDITIPDIPAAEGDYKLTMQTQLVGDDHPNNDKKTQTWIIQRPDITPPTTTVTLSGTMGQNNWYVSNVQVTLTATDGKWPMGVNHTYYKIDGGSYQEYTVPFAVETDGQHTVFFYSDDKAVPPNVEEEQSISFQMDKTAPEFINYSFTPLNFMKNKWLCVATVEDDTSGLDYVEFYVDDALVGSVDAPGPYEFEFDGKPTTSSQALAYDLAGNSALSEVATAMEFGYQQQMYPVKIL